MLKFDKASHTYKNIHTDEEYVSATSLINKFKKKFDVELHAKRVADKEGVTAEEIKQRWKSMNTQSKVKGSKVHDIIDVYNKTGKVDEEYAALIDSLRSLELYDPLKSRCEELVYNHVFKIAGTADVIEDLGNTFNVYDFKTNKKFNLCSNYKSYLLAPLSHLSECEYNIYALQLSLYAFMYHTMTGKTIGKLGIAHVDDNNKFTVYYTPYMYSDIMKMFSYGRSNNT